jgi:adenine-specific DNA-methyltransferase
LVQSILSSKSTAPQADTSTLEAEIDQLVYALYGLDETEIALIEASLAGK